MTLQMAATRRPLWIGHMGAAGLARANSLESIEAGLRLGIDLVELDVCRSSDGHLVLSHFDWIPPDRPASMGRVARTRAGLLAVRGFRQWPRISQLTLEELSHLPFPPPRLDEALALMRGRAIPYLDMRTTDAEALVRLIREHAPDGALLGSGPQRSFTREIALLPSLQATSGVALPLFSRALSAESLRRFARSAIRRARAKGATGLSAQYRLVRPPLLEVCREEGFFVFAWTVDDPSVMRRLAEYGVDGITTNRPDLLATALA